jgi:hypothetical protein
MDDLPAATTKMCMDQNVFGLLSDMATSTYVSYL